MTVQSIIKDENQTPVSEFINRALAALLAAWGKIGSGDIIIRQNGEPVAVLIPYEDYQILIEEEILEDIRDGREAAALYEAWLEDRSTGIPYTEIRAELVAEGLYCQRSCS